MDSWGHDESSDLVPIVGLCMCTYRFQDKHFIILKKKEAEKLGKKPGKAECIQQLCSCSATLGSVELPSYCPAVMMRNHLVPQRDALADHRLSVH